MDLCGLNTNPLIVFVHTPKIGGTSLHALLETNYPRQGMLFRHGHRMANIHGSKKFNIENVHIRKFVDEVNKNPQLKYIGGHLPYGVHEYVDRECKYITILRDPVKRVVSLFKHVLRCENDIIYNYWKKNYNLTPLDILQARDFRVCEDMTRMITGGEVNLKYALHLLNEKYSWVGVLDKIDNMIISLQDMLNLKNTEFPKLNMDEDINISQDLKNIILSRNIADNMLYKLYSSSIK